MRYFDHDTQASKDDRILSLRIDCGGAAVDAYWTLLEKIYEVESDLVIDRNQPETKSVCFCLGIGFDQLNEWVNAMCEYALFERIDIDGNAYSIRSKRASENIKKFQARAETARQNGKKGGRKPSKNQVGSEQEPDTTPDGGVSKRKRKSNKEDISNDISEKRFVPPTVDMVKAYAEEKGYANFDADKFVNFYESKGWMVGRNRMKQWTSAVSNARSWCVGGVGGGNVKGVGNGEARCGDFDGLW